MASIGATRSQKLPFQVQPATTHPLQPSPELSEDLKPPLLPGDLLRKIFALLSSQGLRDVARVCRDWRHAAQETPNEQFKIYKNLIAWSLNIHLKPEQREQLNNNLEKAAQLLDPKRLTNPDSWKCVVTDTIQAQLKIRLIEALELLGKETLEKLDQNEEIQFRNRESLFKLAELSRQI